MASTRSRRECSKAVSLQVCIELANREMSFISQQTRSGHVHYL